MGTTAVDTKPTKSYPNPLPPTLPDPFGACDACFVTGCCLGFRLPRLSCPIIDTQFVPRRTKLTCEKRELPSQVAPFSLGHTAVGGEKHKPMFQIDSTMTKESVDIASFYETIMRASQPSSPSLPPCATSDQPFYSLLIIHYPFPTTYYDERA